LASCRIINFKGVEIIYTDVSKSSVTECLEILDTNHELFTNREKDSVLSLVNVEKTNWNSKLIRAVLTNVKRNNPYVKTTVVIGLNSIKRAILDTIIAVTGRDIQVLESYEEACLWLYDKSKSGEIPA